MALTALLLTLSGCGTLFTGTEDVITFESRPPGARILVNGVEKGTTPLTIPVGRSLNETEITVLLRGYETRRFLLEKEFNRISILNFFNVLFWGIDAVTGAIYTYRPTYYEIRLEPDALIETDPVTRGAQRTAWTDLDRADGPDGRPAVRLSMVDTDLKVVEGIHPGLSLVVERRR